MKTPLDPTHGVLKNVYLLFVFFFLARVEGGASLPFTGADCAALVPATGA